MFQTILEAVYVFNGHPNESLVLTLDFSSCKSGTWNKCRVQPPLLDIYSRMYLKNLWAQRLNHSLEYVCQWEGPEILTIASAALAFM